MTKMFVNGVEITTNYTAPQFPIWDGRERPKTMSVHKEKFGEGLRCFLERMVALGYKRVTFYETTTRVRGYHEFYAFCKR